jgi:TRAP-type mannitol/chloroaromatic compound transport system permease large subunit
MVGVAPKGTTIGEVAWAALPYIGCTLFLVVLLVIWPQIALWLPSMIRY